MLVTRNYEREKALLYAERYAFAQNPIFGDFRDIGGNCTNFASQCVYAGCCKMNYTKTFGWYYISLDERSPSWTGVEFFYNFITENQSIGPFGKEVSKEECEIGDIIQLGNQAEGFYHTLVIVGFEEDDILIAAQTNDAFRRPLSTYEYENIRFIKILGVRFEVPSSKDCFDSVYQGIAVFEGG